MGSFQVNERGTGSAQCHPRTMLALLIHCHANGIFGSRRIERATHRDIGVRYVGANCHPDHDTICTFRRNSFDAVTAALGAADRVLADSGCATGREVLQLEGRGVEVLVATGAEGRRRRHDFRPEPPPKPAKEPRAEWIKAMQERMELPENRARCRLRRHAVEPVFGIVKQAMGFRAVPAARCREGGGRVEAGDAGLQLPTPAQADVGLTGSWGGELGVSAATAGGRKRPPDAIGDRWRDATPHFGRNDPSEQPQGASFQRAPSPFRARLPRPSPTGC